MTLVNGGKSTSGGGRGGRRFPRISELLFRGLIQSGLQGWFGEPYGWALALAVASIAFGICHWLNATYAIIAGAMGIYLGGLFLLVDDLAAPIVAHAVYDFGAILYLTRASRWPSVAVTADEEDS